MRMLMGFSGAVVMRCAAALAAVVLHLPAHAMSDDDMMEMWNDEQQRQQQRFDAEQEAFREEAEAARRHEADLRSRLERCGNCADRAQLVAELAQIAENRRRANIVFCASFDLLKPINPGLEGISRLLGVEQACKAAGLDKNSLEEAERSATVEALKKQAASGAAPDLHAVGAYYASVYGRDDYACPWFLRAARLDHMPSVIRYTAVCAGRNDASEESRSEVVGFTTRCAQRAVPHCLAVLGRFHTPTYRIAQNRRYLPVDEAKALAYFEQAAKLEPKNDYYRQSADELKVKLGSMAAPVEPAKPLGLANAQLKSGVYSVLGNSGQYGGICTVRALGGDRYEFKWAIEARRPSPGIPPSRTLVAKVVGETVQMEMDGGYVTYNIERGLKGSPDMLMNYTSRPFETLKWQGDGPAAASSPASSNAPDGRAALPARPGTSNPLCQRLARNVELNEAAAQRNPRAYESRLAKSRAKYEAACGNR